eukprot:gnl/Ergobibamus_cyprinoides/1390.p1 GENE.gnl/Ergobibamus_cyprinoides/1390~~gnl/Ergobibamus_cyprinoides/1390.p1  ORF type:complete len:305 (+),score=72.30 gnl/Ergobibamus_cyprinoides/1390:329-1243(+)
MAEHVLRTHMTSHPDRHALRTAFENLVVCRAELQQALEARDCLVSVDPRADPRVGPADERIEACRELLADAEAACPPEAEKQLRTLEPEFVLRVTSTQTQADIVRDPSKPLPQDFLRRYVQHARAHCRPAFENAEQDDLVQLYDTLRRASQRHGGTLVSVRHLEGILRIAQAHAKMRLLPTVDKAAISFAMRMMVHSFISQQKSGSKGSLEHELQGKLPREGEAGRVLAPLLHSLMSVALERRAAELGVMQTEATVRLSSLAASAATRGYTASDVNRWINGPSFADSGFAVVKDGDTTVFVRAK